MCQVALGQRSVLPHAQKNPLDHLGGPVRKIELPVVPAPRTGVGGQDPESDTDEGPGNVSGAEGLGHRGEPEGGYYYINCPVYY